LYALSNGGSLLALVSYPFVIEPRLTRHAQAQLWGWGLVLYALGCVWCAANVWKSSGPIISGSVSNAEKAADKDQSSPSPSLIDRALWLLLPACASVLLLAITNKLCQDVAVVPFLWVLPLGLYLLSFIICFDSSRWYARFPFALGLAAAASAICWALFHPADLSVWKQLLIYSGGLFVCCMVCHGELYRLRPEPRYLTGYYLLIAAGGALGGLFVAVMAPLLFTDYYELHWGLAACALLFTCLCIRDAVRMRGRSFDEKTKRAETATRWRAVLRSSLGAPGEWNWLGATLPLLVFWGLDRFFAGFGQELGQAPNRSFIIMRAALWGMLLVLVISWIARGKLKRFRHWPRLTCCWLVLGTAGLGTSLWMQALKSGGGVVYISRNFYGVLTVYERELQTTNDHYFLLRHGRITHGLQFVEPKQALWPTAYYGEESGIGLAMQALPDRGARLGLVGLGVGTLTAYSRPDDVVRIYEINPEVEKVARTRFTYLNRCACKVEVVPGDARLSLEREPSQQFDLLALDAFNSDSIPVHLLTREAFEVYDRHLKTNGILALHISNHYLDLEPVVAGLAQRFHFQSARIEYDEMPDQWWLYPSTWVLLTRDPNLLSSPELAVATSTPSTNSPAVPLWTDDYASLFRILRTK
jgi:SAM-dependent methyltransferase